MSLLLALTAAGGSGVNYTLSGASGSYSLTGQAATFQVSRALSGAAGSYALTGQAATFKVGHALTGAAGSYTLTGRAATLTYTPGSGAVAYSLSGAAGAYLMAGQSATMTYTSSNNGWLGGAWEKPAGRKLWEDTEPEEAPEPAAVQGITLKSTKDPLIGAYVERIASAIRQAQDRRLIAEAAKADAIKRAEMEAASQAVAQLLEAAESELAAAIAAEQQAIQDQTDLDVAFVMVAMAEC